MDGQTDAPAPAHEEPPRSYLAQLKEGDRHWPWHVALRGLIILLNLIGIGCAAWLVASVPTGRLSYSSLNFASGAVVGALVLMCISLLWCAIVLVYFLAIRPHKHVHPGFNVAFDLLLWLAFLGLGLFVLASVFAVYFYDGNGQINDPNGYTQYTQDGETTYTGYYELAPNNDTLIYKITNIRSIGSDTLGDYTYNYTTGEYDYDPQPELTADDIVRDCEPEYSTCAEQDATINEVYRSLPARKTTTIIVDAVCWLNLLLHFALFVWACVKTAKRNRGGKDRKYQTMATRIVEDMEKKGMITVHRRPGDEQVGLTGQTAPIAGGPAQPGQAHVAGEAQPHRNVISSGSDEITMAGAGEAQPGVSRPQMAHVGDEQPHAR